MQSYGLVAFAAVLLLAHLHLILMIMQSWEHRRFVRSRVNKNLAASGSQGATRARVALFAPCKGVDIELEENLRLLFLQDYRNYELNFIVENERDPAYAVILRLTEQYPDIAARVIISDEANYSGQKVHNLLAATSNISSDVEILAFVDSDTRPGPNWLRLLVRRLSREEVGVTTAYRCFVPKSGGPANYLLSGINTGIATLFASGGNHLLVWGGSWAILRKTFERIDLRREWSGTLSDDLVVSRLLHRLKLRIEFEPSCMAASPIQYNYRQMFEFLRRQYVIARVYAPLWWGMGLLSTNLAVAAFWGSLAMLIYGVVQHAAWTLPVGISLAWLYLGQALRAWLRQDAVRYYRPDVFPALRNARRFDYVAGPLIGLVNWAGMTASLVGSHVTWRGIRYRLRFGGKVEIVSRTPQEENPPAISPLPSPHFSGKDHAAHNSGASGTHRS